MAEEFRREIIRSHFSHPHPLKLIVYKQTLNILFPCAGCKLKPSGMLYSCSNCDYFLHQSCFEMPKKLTHPLHKKHELTLMIKPAYRLVCDACGEGGKGFSYHCKPCSFDLHMLCAMLPLSVTHEYHTMHKLNLTSESPYPDNTFSCDICSSVGSRQWLYRCKSCGFDAHLKCAAGDKFPSSRTTSQSKEPTPPEAAPTCSIVAPSAPQLPPMQQQQHQQQNIVPPDPSFEVNRRNNELARQAIQQMIINNSGALAQAIVSGGFVGGYDGDNTGLHLVIEWISALNISGNISGGGGGGGGISAFDAFASGGGSGQDSLHTVNNDGDGGARDVAGSVQRVNDGGGGSQNYMKAVVLGGGGGGGGSLPERITHNFDNKHDLTLQTKPAYSEGRFICDACGESSKGYSYNCQPCGIDLHVSCAMMPFFVTHDSHVHTLRLVFGSPYPKKKFTCGICLGSGSHHWLYRCNSCGFDAHLKCAAGDVTRVHLPPASQPQDASAWGRPPTPMMNMSFPEDQLPVNVPSFGVDNRANTAMAQGLMRFISNGVNISGGGGGGGEEDYQELLFGDGNGIGFLGSLLGG